MQKTLGLLLLVLSLQIHAQISITNQSLTKPDVAHLYLGVTNKIVVSGVASQYTLTSSAGSTINKDTANQFLVSIKFNNAYDTLKIVAKGKVLYQKVFLLKRIYNVIATIGNIKTQQASKAEILLQPFLILSFNDALYKMPMRITGFTFMSKSGNTTTPELKANGPQLTPDMIDCIKSLKSGAVIYFDNIVAIAPDSPGRSVRSIQLTIR
ncbi:MAG: hypothetical protein M0D57_07295 [Sphingobacteriales bacterium JAD_PAG50586_3]|nr:MAG: hypothetical protein M0D57_07295 [Sphingobacteriales bacterium JAD_PAG50586_3]